MRCCHHRLIPMAGFLLLGLLTACGSRGVERLGSIPGRFGGVAVSGGHVYLVGNWETPGLTILELSEGGGSLKVKSEFPLPGGALDIVVGGSRAYVSCSPGLVIIDVSDPSSPVRLGALRIGTATNGQLALSGSILVRARELIDVSDPTSPVRLASMELPSDWRSSGRAIRDVKVSGSFAYLVTGRPGLFIFDISEPANPVLISNYESREGYVWARGFSVQGARGYLAYPVGRSRTFFGFPRKSGSGSWIHILDLSKPSTPRLIHKFETSPGPAQDVLVSGSFLYVADDSGGLKVFDVSDPLAPSLAGHYKTKGYADRLAASQRAIAVRWRKNQKNGILILAHNP